jgi:hypothetical protein
MAIFANRPKDGDRGFPPREAVDQLNQDWNAILSVHLLHEIRRLIQRYAARRHEQRAGRNLASSKQPPNH